MCYNVMFCHVLCCFVLSFGVLFVKSLAYEPFFSQMVHTVTPSIEHSN
nr:MAG TPA: hypothetical protein [Bacteriophage sp.]